MFASDYNITDDDVACGRADDSGTYQYAYSREGVVQVSLYGAQPNRAVQYVNLDYVWSRATFNNPIEKEEDDLLRVIYSFVLGN